MRCRCWDVEILPDSFNNQAKKAGRQEGSKQAVSSDRTGGMLESSVSDLLASARKIRPLRAGKINIQ